MAYDETATDYHLTFTGWMSGSPPAARVESWVRVAVQESEDSRIRVRWRPVWANPDIPASERAKIRERYRRFMGSGRDTIVEQPF